MLQGMTVQPLGYSAAHAIYPALRNERAREAYSTHNAEVVAVEVRVVVKLPGKLKEVLVHDCIEAVDHIPVHIGANDLKNILYSTVILKWNEWTNNCPLPINSIVMRNHNWVALMPRNPDRDVIAEQFFKPGKKGNTTFKKGKAIVNLHVPNDIYGAVLACKEAEEFKAEKALDDLSTATANFTLAKTNKKRERSISPSSTSQLSSDIIQISTTPIQRPKPVARYSKRLRPASAMGGAKSTTMDNWSGACQVSNPSVSETPVQSVESSIVKSGKKTHELSAEQISQALRAQRCPTNKEIRPFCKFIANKD
ncbi:hypothetical protein APHAL10511_004050 [Amanita phalloides]|nr:hypothetical protein APHAL10511_004050 [Amanita phalloides]